MADVLKAVAYARFSSDLQREESIEAQVRAIKEFAEKNGYALQKVYADRGISGTTDKRPEFQHMIDDAKNGKFDVVIVHKFDRFARSRYDSAIYRKELDKHNVKLISVVENFGDSPEMIILEGLLESMSEYYVVNLAREVRKGLKENALSCRHTGGTPCLGYDVDKSTMKLVINEWEAEAVKLIFKLYLEGYGYTYIIGQLNKKGYKTKRGASFGRNSLYEILRNEKYSGVYVYNLSASKNAEGKFNRHKSKPDDEVIRIEGGVPQIITTDDFQKVQMIMKARQRKTAAFKAKQEYLLSGKIVCNECGCTYAWNSRKANSTHPLYISYRCTKRNGKIKCKNPEINRDLIESIVQKRLADKVFDERVLPEVISKYNEFAASKNTELISSITMIKDKIAETEKGIANIVNVIMQTGSVALSDKLKELECDKANFEQTLHEKEQALSEMTVDEKVLKQAFKKAKKMLESGTLSNKKAIIDRYVKQITLHRDKIVIEFNVTDTYTITEEIERQ